MTQNHGRWDTGRWSVALLRQIAYWYNNGWPGQKIRALDSWMWDKAREHQDKHRLKHFQRNWWTILRNKLPRTHVGGTKWEWAWQPRTCSYCGGIHPEDAILLAEQGWVVEGTTKAYKRYLHPPRGSGWDPVPPVKLYVTHFDEDDVKQFNATLHDQ